MTTIQVGAVTVETLDGTRSFLGKPLDDRDGADREGVTRLARMTTSDGLIANVGATEWPHGSHDQRLIDFIAGPDAYRRLERAGNMSLNVVPGGVVAVLRAMKFTGRDMASLQAVGWEQLDDWLGQDAGEYFAELGAVKVGTHGELRPDARRFTNDPAILVDPEAPDALFAAFALTRIHALAVDFGLDGVEAIH